MIAQQYYCIGEALGPKIIPTRQVVHLKDTLYSPSCKADLVHTFTRLQAADQVSY